MKQRNICRCIHNQRWLLLSFFAPIFILWCIYIFKGVYPFGDHHILISDARSQYFPFLVQLQQRLQTGESLFYSWNNALGSNFWSLIAYYCLSPLNLLTVLIPSSWLLVVYMILLTVKMGTISLTCAIFLKKVFHRNDASLVLFSCMYAFSAYFMSYYWNTMWLDSIAMLPLLCLGTYALITEGKFKLYTISLTLGILFNYLVGVYLCIFTFFSFIYWWISLKLPHKLAFRRLGRIVVCSVIALCIAAVFLLPTAFCVANTPRADAQFPSLTQLNTSLTQFLARLGAAVPVTIIRGAPNLYCGMFCLLLTVTFVFSKQFPLRQRICTLVLLALLVLSNWVTFLEYFWNGFRETFDLPGRFSFLFAFVLIATAYRTLPYWKQLSVFSFLPPLAAGILVITMCLFEYGKKVAVINALLLLAYLVPGLLLSAKKLPIKAVSIIVSIVLTGEILLAGYAPHKSLNYQTYSDYPEARTQIQALLDRIGAQDNTFYRTEILPRQTPNDPSLLGYRGASSFHSLPNNDHMLCLYNIGYSAYATTNRCVYVYENSPFTNALFGIKYLLFKNGQTPVSPYLSLFSSSGDVTAYKNSAVLSPGFMTKATISRPLSENDNAMIRQNELFTAATGVERPLFTILPYTSKTYEGLKISPADNGRDHYILSDEKRGSAVYTFEMPRSGYLYGYVFCNHIEDFIISSDNTERSQEMHRLPAIFCAGYFEEGQQVSFSWNIVGSDNTVAAYAGILNEDVFEAGMETLADEQLQVSAFSESSLSGTIEVKEAGCFFTSIPYDEGWTLYLNGQKTGITPFRNAFIAVEDLSPGIYNVELQYVPPGFTAGICVSLAGIAVFSLMCILDMAAKKRKKHNPCPTD